MDVLIVIAVGTLAGFGVIVYWFLKKISTPKKYFPSCKTCGKYMERRAFVESELPIEMELYLKKWNLPDIVIRRHICPDFHSQVWIAPPIDAMERSMYVWQRTAR